MCVPKRANRSSGIAADFLCENPTYLLGADDNGKPDWTNERYLACRKLHEDLLADVSSPAAKAILAFFSGWDPKTASKHPVLAPEWENIVKGGWLIFCYDMKPVTDDPDIRKAWQDHFEAIDPDAKTGVCLVTGKVAPIAKTHPKIKGVMGAQSSGALLVSFNCESFNSYGKEQGYNAQISEYAAFAYTTALNELLADRDHCRTIGDTTIVCWSQNGRRAYQDVGMFSLFGDSGGINESTLTDAIHKIASGSQCRWNDADLDPDEHFYILGLSPNGGRLSVQFFLRTVLGTL